MHAIHHEQHQIRLVAIAIDLGQSVRNSPDGKHDARAGMHPCDPHNPRLGSNG